MAYSEIHDNELGATAAGFWARANTFFAAAGIHVEAVMTDNGSWYSSRDFADADQRKVERFNRALAAEWAYARHSDSDAARKPRPARTGCITTITTDHTPASAGKPHQIASTTSRGTTPRGCRLLSFGEWRQCAALYASRTAWLMRPREETSWPFALAHSRIFASCSEFPRFGALPALARPDRPVTLRAAAM